MARGERARLLPRDAIIAAGRAHSVLVTDEVFEPGAGGAGGTEMTMCHSWGSAAGGRLGLGMYEEATYPELIPDLNGEPIVDARCGLDHTLALVRQWP